MSAGPAGSVAGLWRYPVSSMGGEALERATIEPCGVLGDRVAGLVDPETGRIASPGRDSHFVAVPQGFARHAGGQRVEISADGQRWATQDDAEELDRLAAIYGFRPTLQPFAERGSDGFRPRYEHAPIHLITTAALRSLSATLPDSIVEPQRFRPNILVEWPDGAQEVPEHGWVGREIRIGGLVLHGRAPCRRCPFIGIAQHGVPRDAEVLRTVVKRHDSNFGLYCDVAVPAEIRLGDSVALA